MVFLTMLAGGARLSSGARPQQNVPSTTPVAPVIPPDQLNQLVGQAQVWLADLIRIDTTNPPGNEMTAAKYVAGVLQKENIPVEILEIAPGRGVAIAQLQAGPLRDPVKGTAAGGAYGRGRGG